MDQRDDQKVVQSSEAVKSKEGSCKTSGSPCVPAKRKSTKLRLLCAHTHLTRLQHARMRPPQHRPLTEQETLSISMSQSPGEQIFNAPRESGQSPEPTAASVQPEQPLVRA